MEDHIGFHTFLSSVRREKKIAIERLGYGLYSASMMSYIESGERLPDYLMRNRIMDRLGISAEDYEDYVSADEYRRYQYRNELMTCIDCKDIVMAKKLLYTLEKTCNKQKKIEYQFLLNMKAAIMKLENCNPKYILDTYESAVAITIPNYEMIIGEKMILSTEEYYLLINVIWYRYVTGKYSEAKTIELLKALLEDIDCSPLSEMSKCKIFPIAVYKFFLICKDSKECYSVKNKRILEKEVDKSIAFLRTSNRLYWLKELLEIKIELQPNDGFSREVYRVLTELYDTYDIDCDNEEDTYIYKYLSLYEIGSLIKKRRGMVGLTRRMLSDGICSLKTLERIESGKTNPQKFVFSKLMEKMGLDGDYRRTEFLTNDYRLISTYNEYKKTSNESRNIESKRLLDKIKKSVCTDYPMNNQIIKRLESLIKLRNKEQTVDQFVEEMKEILSMTGIDINQLSNKDCYFSRSEILCLYSIALRGKSNADALIAKKELFEYCSKMTDKDKSNELFSRYELIMSWYANICGNEGNYDESSKYSFELIRESLKRKRSSVIAKEIYNMVWNTAMQNKDPLNPKYLEDLEKSRILYMFSERYNKENFIIEKEKKLTSGLDWTA